MQEIKNIIFDFGGVFIDVDYKKTEKAFIDAGITNFHDLYSQHAASPLFEQLEKGEVDSDHFHAGLRNASGISLTGQQIDDCWNSMLGDFYPEAIEKAKELQERYRIFLFSNTNSIHYECVMNKYQEQFGKRDFDSIFEKAYYSHTAGIRKPYPEAYEWVLKDAGLTAAETLFIDDTISNIEGAKQAGLQTIFLEPPAKMWELAL
jgi:FMN phosphatase YigB (HAD superfamily)